MYRKWIYALLIAYAVTLGTALGLDQPILALAGIGFLSAAALLTLAGE